MFLLAIIIVIIILNSDQSGAMNWFCTDLLCFFMFNNVIALDELYTSTIMNSCSTLTYYLIAKFLLVLRKIKRKNS